jgi:hypothetical protein
VSLAQAEALDPSGLDPRPSVLHDMAMALRALGRSGEAATALRRAVDLAALERPPRLLAYYTAILAEEVTDPSEARTLLLLAARAAEADRDQLMARGVALMLEQLDAGLRPSLPA